MNDEIELKELVTQSLRSSGVLAKIKAQLLSSIYNVLDETNKSTEKSHIIENEKLKIFLKSNRGPVVASIIEEFLEHFGLNYTAAVFRAETNQGEFYVRESRASLLHTLGLRNDDSTILEFLVADNGDKSPLYINQMIDDERVPPVHGLTFDVPNDASSGGSDNDKAKLGDGGAPSDDNDSFFEDSDRQLIADKPSETSLEQEIREANSSALKQDAPSSKLEQPIRNSVESSDWLGIAPSADGKSIASLTGVVEFESSLGSSAGEVDKGAKKSSDSRQFLADLPPLNVSGFGSSLKKSTLPSIGANLKTDKSGTTDLLSGILVTDLDEIMSASDEESSLSLPGSKSSADDRKDGRLIDDVTNNEPDGCAAVDRAAMISLGRRSSDDDDIEEEDISGDDVISGDILPSASNSPVKDIVVPDKTTSASMDTQATGADDTRTD